MGINPIENFFSGLANKFKKDHPHVANAPLQLESIGVLLQEAAGHLNKDDLQMAIAFINKMALKGKLSPGQEAALATAIIMLGSLLKGIAADFHKEKKQ